MIVPVMISQTLFEFCNQRLFDILRTDTIPHGKPRGKPGDCQSGLMALTPTGPVRPGGQWRSFHFIISNIYA